MSNTPLHPEQLQGMFDSFRQNATNHAARVQAAGARYVAGREATDAAIRGLGGPLRGMARPTAAIAATVAVGAVVYGATKLLSRNSALQDREPGWTDRIIQQRSAAPQCNPTPGHSH